MENLWVISLGGSKIVPDKVDEKFLSDFKKLILSNKSQKFAVITGGGSTARKYMSALRKLRKSESEMSEEGIEITRYHAKFMARLFNQNENQVAKNMKKVKTLLRKNQIVFCGALRQTENQTTDSTAAKLAKYLNCSFINLTDTKGLYDKDPKKYEEAKFIPEISWNNFYKIAKKIKFESGQHFVLDQKAAKEIKQNKTKTYIIGSLKQLENIIKNKKFIGTRIEK